MLFGVRVVAGGDGEVSVIADEGLVYRDLNGG